MGGTKRWTLLFVKSCLTSLIRESVAIKSWSWSKSKLTWKDVIGMEWKENYLYKEVDRNWQAARKLHVWTEQWGKKEDGEMNVDLKMKMWGEVCREGRKRENMKMWKGRRPVQRSRQPAAGLQPPEGKTEINSFWNFFGERDYYLAKCSRWKMDSWISRQIWKWWKRRIWRFIDSWATAAAEFQCEPVDLWSRKVELAAPRNS